MSKPSKAVIAEMMRLYRRGELKPRSVVAAARNPRNPLHHCFEWDQRKGHEAYLLQQARDLIRSAEVQIVVVAGEPAQPVRQFLNVVNKGRHEWVPFQVVDRSKAMQQAVLLQMEIDWKRLFNKYQRYAQFWPMVLAAAPKSRRPKRKKAA